MKIDETRYYELEGEAKELLVDNDFLKCLPITPSSILAIAMLYLENKENK